MRELLNSTATRASRYIEDLKERSVAPKPSAVRRLADLNIPLPKIPTPPEQVLELLDDVGSPATMATSGGRFFGFVIGGALPAAVAANWMATAWDQNVGLFVASPIAVTLEQVALRWLLEVLHLPPTCGGSFITGAAMANFTALAAARHAVLKNAGWDVEANGLFGAPEIHVVISEEAHPTLIKSLGLLGLGRDRVTKASVDDQGRIRTDKIPTLAGPTIVCVQAGNVNTGSFDPIKKICALAHDAGAWVHVDGAFGMWVGAAPARAHLAAGIPDADSWATDAHKWLNVPYDSGLTFVRNPDALRSAMAFSAAYLPEGEHRKPLQYTPELSRRGRGIEVWAALLSLGRDGLSDLIERTCRHAARFAEGLQAAGYEILNDVVINQVLVSFGDPETTQKVIADIQSDGTCWCGGTEWQGRTAMRISVCSWATTEEDVQKSLDAMIRIARNRSDKGNAK